MASQSICAGSCGLEYQLLRASNRTDTCSGHDCISPNLTRFDTASISPLLAFLAFLGIISCFFLFVSLLSWCAGTRSAPSYEALGSQHFHHSYAPGPHHCHGPGSHHCHGPESHHCHGPGSHHCHRSEHVWLLQNNNDSSQMKYGEPTRTTTSAGSEVR
jgi:hypothetical protein